MTHQHSLVQQAANPILSTFDYVLINTSGGKDSQTAMRRVVTVADEQGYPRNCLIAVHASLGRMEWQGTCSLAEQHSRHYGIEFHVVHRHRADGKRETLLDYVRRRGKWPSSQQRYCTSDFKRGPCRRIITMLAKRIAPNGYKFRRVRILNVFGFRAEESPARRKKIGFELDTSASSKPINTTGRRSLEVWNWLPIHGWTEDQVWNDIHKSGVPYHDAYDKGMPRLSCVLCIFAPRAALIIAGRENPELLDEYVALEQEIGHDFQHGNQSPPLRAPLKPANPLALSMAHGTCRNYNDASTPTFHEFHSDSVYRATAMSADVAPPIKSGGSHRQLRRRCRFYSHARCNGCHRRKAR